MIVGAAGNQLDTACLQLCSHSLGILDDLACVLLELRLQCLTEANRLGRDNMLERTALGAREYSGVNALCQNSVVGQDQAAAAPRSVLWVVVVTTSAYGIGFWC